jgi:hypothetical protein
VAEEQSRLAAKHGDCKAVTNEDRYKLRDTRNKKDGGHTVPVIVNDGDAAGTVLWCADKDKEPVDGEEPTTSGPSKAERAMSKEIKRMADWLRDDKNVASWFASATTSERLCLALAFGVTSVCDLNGEHSYEKLGTYQSLLEIGDVSGIFAEHIRGSMLEYIRSEKVTGCGPIYERCVKLDELFGCDRTVARKVEVQDGV